MASIMILMCHLYYVGVEEDYPFSLTFIFVEFFFILTGYFSYVHISKDMDEIGSLKNKVTYALRYVINKLRKILPMTVVAILINYIIEYAYRRNEDGVTLFWFWEQLPFDILEVSDLYTEPRVVPLWYLSVELFILPLICLIILQKKYIRIIVSILVPLTCYLVFGVNNLRNFPYDYLRGLSAMLLGVLIGEVTEILKKKISESKHKLKISLIFYFVGNILMMATVFFSFYDLNIMALSLADFVVGLTLIISADVVSTQKIKRAAAYLGSLSVPIFIFQWVVGTGVLCLDRVVGYFYSPGLSVLWRSIIYIAVTILIAMGINHIRTVRLKRKAKRNI